ncbi:cleavage and polyadenylation specificity factor subunit 2 [Planoprotostelium fungivorum]|uniref:Cleavage and polyadenylation specificity factor subunit 2 n=1 Tax=Planoprotostelium fungivorum TaxID=1890364 RepID=A0A2P6N2D0_9EUKA|nr:cleavage and polyadenylation specificity factor subunit 2 [Planoprotostelium fungivorum]
MTGVGDLVVIFRYKLNGILHSSWSCGLKLAAQGTISFHIFGQSNRCLSTITNRRTLCNNSRIHDLLVASRTTPMWRMYKFGQSLKTSHKPSAPADEQLGYRMTAIIKFTPLCGVKGHDPLSYLLEIDDTVILLDCGWTPDMDESLLEPIREHVKRIQVVLVSHPDLRHIGALPHVVNRMGLNATIYGTIPVYKMGQMLMYDVYQCKEGLDLEDVDAAFDDRFRQLKYQEHVTIQGGIQIIPYRAGHTLGGTIWKIKKETEDIVYAVQFNQKKEAHLSGASFEHLQRPSMLITDATARANTAVNRKQRDIEFISSIMDTIHNGGSVLIPTDSSARVLEAALVLESHWTKEKLDHPVALLSFMSNHVITAAKSQLEFMSEEILQEAERHNPFAFKCVTTCNDLAQLEALPKGPRVILCSVPDMQYGFSRQLFAEMAETPLNRVIFLGREVTKSLASRLQRTNGEKNISFELRKRVPLEGSELEAYHIEKNEEEDRRRMALNQRAEEDSDDEEEEKRVSFEDSYDMTREQFANAGFRHPMFPYKEVISKYDDYGEPLQPDEFKIEDDEEKKEKKSSESVIPEEQEEIPTKLVVEQVKVQIRCSIVSVDFEGISDLRSVKAIVQQMLPRKLILVDGTKEDKEALAAYWQKSMKSTGKSIYVPQLRESLDLTSDTKVFKIKLHDDLADALRFHSVQGYQVAYVEGTLQYRAEDDGDTQQRKRRAVSNGDANPTAVPILDILPDDQRTGHSIVVLGDVKLPDLKEVLLKAGHRSELQEGVLVTTDGGLSVQKRSVEGRSHIEMETSIGAQYFATRKLLNSQYTIV